MKKKAKRSNRNRHTGRVNAFKQWIFDNGREVLRADRVYIAAMAGNRPRGRTYVRA